MQPIGCKGCKGWCRLGATGFALLTVVKVQGANLFLTSEKIKKNMINKATVSSYCKDDIRLIENYEKAVADRTAVWHCHHRLQLTLDGQYAVSKSDLIRMDMYYCRPHYELILLHPTDHNKIHCMDKSHRCEIARKTPHTRNCTLDSEAEFYESLMDDTMAEIDSAVEDAIRSGAKPIGIIDRCVCDIAFTHT